MKSGKIVTRRLHELKPNERNPRRISAEAMGRLKKSIMIFGNAQPIVIDEYNNIIAGHQRCKAMMEMEIQVPIQCWEVSGLSDEEKQVLTIRLNNNDGFWVKDDLQAAIDEIQQDFEEFDMDILGFDDGELEKIGIVIEMPSFEVAELGGESQPRLDERKKIICPECGCEFEPK